MATQDFSAHSSTSTADRLQELAVRMARRMAASDPELAELLTEYDLEIIYRHRAARAAARAQAAAQHRELQSIGGWM